MRISILLFLAIFTMLACDSASNASNESNAENPTENSKTEIKNSDPLQFVSDFVKDLGKKDFQAAYAKTDGKIWGTYEDFSSEKAFGGISSTEIHEIALREDEAGKKVVFVDATYEAKGGNNRYLEYFHLEKKDKTWQISKLKVTDAIALQEGKTTVKILKTQNLVSDEVILKILAAKYEANVDDKPTINKKIFYFDGKKKAIVFLRRSPDGEFHMAMGTTDVAILTFSEGKWKETFFAMDFLGGGDYGSSGTIGELQFFGKNNLCVGYTTTHIMNQVGDGSYTSLIGIIEDKPTNISGFSLQFEDSSGEHPERDYSVKYAFKENGETYYDLILDITQGKRSKEIVKFENGGYKVKFDPE
jgi:hypothetical protein